MRNILSGRQLDLDIANGIPAHDTFKDQRKNDNFIGFRKSSGVLANMLTDDLIEQGVENRADIGEVTIREGIWCCFFVHLFDAYLSKYGLYLAN